jgi:hypothetical protein
MVFTAPFPKIPNNEKTLRFFDESAELFYSFTLLFLLRPWLPRG